MARYITLLLTFVLCCSSLFAQDGGYQVPPKQIADMLLAKTAPGVSVDNKGEYMLMMETSSYPSVEELARPELKIAGLRINPANYSLSRQNYVTNIYLQQISTGKQLKISGLPANLAAGNISWNPANTRFSFQQITGEKVDLYVVDVATQKATKVNKTALNAILGGAEWIDNNTLLYKTIVKPVSDAPKRPAVPEGPAVQENYGRASPRPTFQDLIKSPFDEQLFEFYATAQLVKNSNGEETKIGQPAIYLTTNISPDKKYMLVRKVNKPFSYTVPYSGFPSTVMITDMQGKPVKQLASLPSSETAPSGNDNVQYVPRAFNWRNDQPATITWCMPLDSGFIKKNVDYHDAVYALEAPFNTEAKMLFKTKMRYRFTTWGNDQLAIVTEALTGKQMIQLDRFNPVTEDLEKLVSRNTTDAYANPGAAVLTQNSYGEYVLQTIDNGNKILFNNTTGSSPKGDLPFLLSFDVHT